MKSYVFTTARGWNLGRYSRKYYPVSKQCVANHAIDPRIVRRGGQGILCSKRSLEIGFYWIISNELDDQNFRVKNTREITTHVIVSRLNVFAISNSLFDAITFFLFFFTRGYSTFSTHFAFKSFLRYIGGIHARRDRLFLIRI